MKNRIRPATNATGSTHVLLVVEGYYSRPGSGGELAAPAAPARLFDSRVSGGPLAAQTSRTIPVAGHAGVPTNATSVLVLLTSVGSSSRNYVVAWPERNPGDPVLTDVFEGLTG